MSTTAAMPDSVLGAAAGVVASGANREYWVWGDRYSFKAVSEDNGGAYCVVEMTAAPGSGTPPHLHHLEHESFFVLEGEMTVFLEEERTVAGPGTFVAAPKGRVHRWVNETTQPLRALVFIVPGGFEKFLMRIGHPVLGAEAAPPVTQEEIDFAMSIAGEYQMDMLG